MQTTRRAVLASGAGLAALKIADAAFASTRAGSDSGTDSAVADLIARSREANAALMRGDADSYFALVMLSDDFTLMSPFGGTPSRGSYTPQRIDAIGRFFRNGTLEQDVVQAYGSSDMVVLATIERAHVEVGGLPAQDWALRVTQVYRREGSGWQLVHRHADPLVAGISLQRAAAIARGERTETT